MSFKRLTLLTYSFALLASITYVMPAYAQTNDRWQGQRQEGLGMMGNRGSDQNQGMMRSGVSGNRGSDQNQGMMRSGVSGTVLTINGNTLTLNGMQRPGGNDSQGNPGNPATYTVDASGATVIKNNATSTLSQVAVGDRIYVQGTVMGTNVVATTIRDGVMGGGMRGVRTGSSTPMGNGQPVVAGTVSVIHGNSVTVTTVSNITYTVDASNAKVLIGRDTADLSKVVVGDMVIVQGAVNNNVVTASTIIDRSHTNNGSNSQAQNGQSQGSFFSRVGHFFMHLFEF